MTAPAPRDEHAQAGEHARAAAAKEDRRDAVPDHQLVGFQLDDRRAAAAARLTAVTAAPGARRFRSGRRAS